MPSIPWVYSVALLTLSVCSAGFVLLFRFGLKSVFKGRSDEQPTVSIVVPARNEEALLPRCLESILGQEDYPPNNIQVIVIDDRSEDRTFEIANSYRERDPRVTVLQAQGNPKGYSPKKNALDQGFACATGEILFPMDADCEADPRWLSSIVRSFEADVSMVSGYAELDRPSLGEPRFIRVQSLELLSLFACAAGSTSLGWYLASSGANQGYRRSTWEEIGGFGRIGPLVSGDDDLMLQRISQKASGRIVFCGAPRARVLTEPMRSVRAFYEQRKRWGSKYPHHRPSYMAFLSLFYSYNVLLFFAPLAAFIQPQLVPAVVAALTIKWTTEYLLLSRAMTLFQRPDLRSLFPLWAILHVPYITLMGPVGLLGRVIWKGRAHGTRSRMLQEESVTAGP